MPADTAWNEGTGISDLPAIPKRSRVSNEAIRDAAKAIRSGRSLILIAGQALRERGLDFAGRIQAKTGAKIMAETFVGRVERGAGRVPIDRLPYPVDQARAALAGFEHIILVGSRVPVAFFAYPDKPSLLAAEGTRFTTLAGAEDDQIGALELLAEELGAVSASNRAATLTVPPLATGTLTDANLSQSIAALLPENAIMVPEALMSAGSTYKTTWTARPHTFLQNMGGAIGLGMPMATGAAIACPDRPVLNLQADGSAMYSIQSLWTQAREGLNVTTVLFNNKSYETLKHELANVGAKDVGRKALDMLDLGRPDMDFVSMAKGMGVPGARVTTMEQFNTEVARGLATPGPYLVEVLMVP